MRLANGLFLLPFIACSGPSDSSVAPLDDAVYSLEAGSLRSEVEIGDSTVVWAEGFTFDGDFSSVSLAGAAWSSFEGGVAFHPPTSQAADGRTYAVAFAPGAAVINVAWRGISGFGFLVVFPQVESLAVRLDNATARVGDTIVVHVSITWKGGAPAPGLAPVISVRGEGGIPANSLTQVPSVAGEFRVVPTEPGVGSLSVSLFDGRYRALAPLMVTR